MGHPMGNTNRQDTCVFTQSKYSSVPPVYSKYINSNIYAANKQGYPQGIRLYWRNITL